MKKNIDVDAMRIYNKIIEQIRSAFMEVKKPMKCDYVIEGMDMVIEYDDKLAKKKGKTAAEKTAAIISVREMSGMNRKEFAEWLKIPYRTMSDWEHGLREMPDYVLHLIAYKVKMEIVEKRGD